jgi:hypothetical protein
MGLHFGRFFSKKHLVALVVAVDSVSAVLLQAVHVTWLMLETLF